MNPKVKEVDRLSELPDQILIHILTFLPTLDAVRTMLLKPFGTLWTLLPNLDFDDTNFWYDTCPDGDDDDRFPSLNLAFFNFVRNVLLGHRGGKITKFRVLIDETYIYYIYARNLSHEVDSWIDFALRKNVEILFIGMFDPDIVYELPMTVFVNDSITEMKLDFLEIMPHTRVQMGKLRVLKLERVDISDGVFQEIIRGCPSLKELEIYNCFHLNELCFDAPNVEKLILDTTLHTKYYGPILDCPNLRVFQFTGNVNCIEVEDLSSLVDVTFNLESEYQKEFKEYEEFMDALKPILSAKVVSFSKEFVIVLFFCMQNHLPEVSMNWKRVELSVWLTEKHIPGLCRLLRKSPYLEELVIDVTWAIGPRHYLQPIESELDNCSIDNEEWSSSSLKRVVIYNISMCLYPILVHLVRNLLKNATVLAELRIYYKARDISHYEPELSPEQWEGFSNELPTFAKASQHVKVLLF